jgi:tetratricopeptide (TPR) repeat protein
MNHFKINKMKKILFDLYCRSKGLVPLVCYLILPVMLASGQSEEIKKSIYLIEVDQTAKAIELLNNTAKAFPSASVVQYHLGEAKLKNGQRDQAAACFDKGISLDADEPLNYVGRAHLSILEDNVQKAQMDFGKAMGMTKSKNVAILNAIAEAYLRSLSRRQQTD